MADAPKTETQEPEEVAKKAPSVDQTVRDYIIPISPQALENWRNDPEGFLEYAKETAKGLYPTLESRLDKHTTRTLVDPYAEVAKSVIGRGVQPDWNDPSWSVALNGGHTEDGKSPAPMKLADWKDYLKSNPNMGFDESHNGQAAMNTAISGLQRMFAGEEPRHG